jgi:hypothetical protein
MFVTEAPKSIEYREVTYVLKSRGPDRPAFALFYATAERDAEAVRLLNTVAGLLDCRPYSEELQRMEDDGYASEAIEDLATMLEVPPYRLSLNVEKAFYPDGNETATLFRFIIPTPAPLPGNNIYLEHRLPPPAKPDTRACATQTQSG